MPLGAFVLDRVPRLSDTVASSLGQGLGSGISKGFEKFLTDKELKQQGLAAGKFLFGDDAQAEVFANMNPEMQKEALAGIYRERFAEKSGSKKDQEGIKPYDAEKKLAIIDSTLGIPKDIALMGDTPEAQALLEERQFILDNVDDLEMHGMPVTQAIAYSRKLYKTQQQQQMMQQQQQMQYEQQKAREDIQRVKNESLDTGLKTLDTDEKKWAFLTESKGVPPQDAEKIMTGEISPQAYEEKKSKSTSTYDLLGSIPASSQMFKSDIFNTTMQLKADDKLFTEEGVQKLIEAGLPEYYARSKLKIYRPATDKEMQEARVKAGYNEAEIGKVLRSMGLVEKKSK